MGILDPSTTICALLRIDDVQLDVCDTCMFVSKIFAFVVFFRW